MIFMGVRPGEVVESSIYKGTNEGILYKDLTVVIGFDDDGSRVYGCLVRIRNRKWARGVEKQAYTMVLRNDELEPSLCPMRQLLALAIADGALQDVDCVEDLFKKYRPPPGQPFSQIPIRPEMHEVPLLRRLAEGMVHDKQIWTYSDLQYMLRGLGTRAGYEYRLTPYAFRRGFGSVLDRFASAVQRRKHMGHKSDDTFLSYLSDISGLNMQDLVNGRDPDHQLMESLQSMASTYRNTECLISDGGDAGGGAAASTSRTDDSLLYVIILASTNPVASLSAVGEDLMSLGTV
ncbi:hypothetical protein CKM354_000004400 [Cercospora kikuchii]|uniref:Uncharacterized protein n=1 Tax=Cercospora kikuchii TaxID=84275 RepID=A0A9P3C527_9PEZI|nr:uncharacterized protein CKM354_000004400 [Cercospora kikuchii]GIZ36574.1 hypothetical protein CKM354_000004400 [Cercospora kikuchii]